MQTQRRGELYTSGKVDTFAILFQPSALGLLFGLPAQEFADQDFGAEDVFGAIIARFHEQLADCDTLEERISVANRFLLQRAVAAPDRDGISLAATLILRRTCGTWIPDMAGQAGMGLRQFERKFVQQVGVSPRLFARIARFEAALDWMARSPQGSWTEVAHHFGYYDQMHMLHDFSRFTGETPTRTLQDFKAALGTAIRAEHAPLSRGERLSSRQTPTARAPTISTDYLSLGASLMRLRSWSVDARAAAWEEKERIRKRIRTAGVQTV
jgi:AraC-like DNA-binding protein